MLELDKLFAKKPFVYFINGEYYAFGFGVCAKCSRSGKVCRYYTEYLECKDNKNITSSEAWKVYRKVETIAETVKSEDGYSVLEKKFRNFNFTKENFDEIERQLLDITKYFRDNHLIEYCENSEHVKLPLEILSRSEIKQKGIPTDKE